MILGEQLLWVLLGMGIMVVWYEIREHNLRKQADAQVQSIQLYNTYTDHGIFDRFMTERETNEVPYPDFKEWNGEWFYVTKYRECRWYVTDTFSRACVYRQPAYKATSNQRYD